MRPPIAHFGTFDVANFGDLLFPLILERRLGDIAPILHVSPKGGAAPILGGIESVAPAAVPDALSGVVVGGGHLIHASPSSLVDYKTPATLALEAYPSLWLGAAEKALLANTPLVWNAPGVPAPFAPRAAPALQWATSFMDAGAVRDARSRAFLSEAGCSAPLEVVPDTGLEVASLFDEVAIDRAYAEAFASRGVERVRPTIALHANSRYLREEIPLVAARIARICTRTGTQPILLALGPCHGDDALARALARTIQGPLLVVDEPRSLCELVACIARSEAYLGSSLHGAITACAFGRKAAIVARERGDGGKFSEFLRSFDLSRWLFADWEVAESAVHDLVASPPEPWEAVTRVSAARLERHWTQVRDALQTPPREAERRREARARRSAMLADVSREFGIHTLLLPHQAELTLDQMTRIERQRQQTAALKASYRDAARTLRRRIAELESNSAQSPPESDRVD